MSSFLSPHARVRDAFTRASHELFGDDVPAAQRDALNAVVRKYRVPRKKKKQQQQQQQGTGDAVLDFQVNHVHRLARTVHLPPRDVAERLASAAAGHLDGCSARMDVVGDGFVCVGVDDAFLGASVGAVAQGGPECLRPAEAKRIVVDFASPNVGKELHVGHLRSTVLGDTLCRLLEFTGHHVDRRSHVGDWGMPTGQILCHADETDAPWLREDEPLPTPAALSDEYLAAKAMAERDGDFPRRAAALLRRLHEGVDPHVQRAWARLCEASRRGWHDIFAQLHVSVEEYGESRYHRLVRGALDDVERAGVATRSEGALCVFTDGFEAPLIIERSDGSPTYASTDVAAVRYRMLADQGDYNWAIYLTDRSQKQHFQQVFDVAARMGWLGADRAVDHAMFGVVQGAAGKKLSSRTGTDLTLSALLEEGRVRARGVLEHAPEGGASIAEYRTLSADEQAHIAAVVSQGAIRYFELAHHRLTDYAFDFDKVLSFKGNTSVYLLYAYARIRSIRRKAGAGVDMHAPVTITHPSERALALLLLEFPHAVEQAVGGLTPNVLCDYLHRLAGQFHSFYSACRVRGSAEEASRLQMCVAVERTMKQSLDLLGVPVLERM